jgi:hypothetical protein
VRVDVGKRFGVGKHVVSGRVSAGGRNTQKVAVVRTVRSSSRVTGIRLERSIDTQMNTVILFKSINEGAETGV